jgi:uncharacterized protein
VNGLALRFEWHDDKAARNRRKHGVTFEEAATVWNDPHPLYQSDWTHSSDEERAKIIGFSDKDRLLAVVFTERDDAKRIISAWKASPAEEAAYAEHLGEKG